MSDTDHSGKVVVNETDGQLPARNVRVGFRPCIPCNERASFNLILTFYKNGDPRL